MGDDEALDDVDELSAVMERSTSMARASLVYSSTMLAILRRR